MLDQNQKFTLGVEEEYMICDSNTGDLVDKASLVMNEFKNSNRFSFELIESEIESNTSVHLSVDDVIKEISSLRNKVNNFGKKNGFSVGISGTHPTGIPEKQTFINNDSYSWVKDQLHYYAKRNMTFSTHVHVGLPDFTRVTDVMNSLRRWIAPLLALSTNSPFFEGKKTGMRSSRTMQFGAFPRTNIPQSFSTLDEYKDVMDKLIEINSIEKMRHIWWKLRPHLDFETLEFRVCDAQRSLKNVYMLTAISRALVHKAYYDKNLNKSKNLSMEYLNDSIWKATRFNLDSIIYDEISNQNLSIKNLIEKMYDYCKDSLDIFGDDVSKEIENIIKNGTECDEQLNYYNNNGIDKLKLFLIDKVEY